MQASHVTRRRGAARAFTLVELMVSVSVLLVLVLLFSNLFNHANNAWTVGQGNAERRRNVRALADFIGLEMQAAILPVGDLASNKGGNVQFIVNPPAAQVPDDYRSADAVFWQAPLATETSQGEIAEIGYFVKWDGDRPMLCRFFVNPSVTSGGTTAANPDYLIYDTDPKKWLSQTLLDKVAPATKAAGYAGLFAENVVGLWVVCYGADGQVNTPAKNGAKFDSREGYDLNKGTAPVDQRYLPASVRISLAQIDSRYAARLAPAVTSLRQLVKSEDTLRRRMDKTLFFETHI